MLNSRSQFIDRLQAYRQAVQSDVLVSRSPTEVEHNARARMLRNGLAVVGYALLEDFVRSRTAEVMQRIGDGSTPFRNLPKDVKIAATEGVFNAVKFQQRFVDRHAENLFGHYQEHASFVASTANSTYQISPLAFAQEQSNLSSIGVEKILHALKIDAPWSAITGVAKRCGVGVLALKNAFESAAERRHAAAHRADADIEYSDLNDYDVEALGVAVGFDLLVSRALRHLLDSDAAYLSNKGLVASKHVSMRLLRYDGKRWWRELSEGSTRASNRNTDFQALKAGATGRARVLGQAVVVQDKRGLPKAWYTPDID